jgi:hypothetical protein
VKFNEKLFPARYHLGPSEKVQMAEGTEISSEEEGDNPSDPDDPDDSGPTRRDAPVPGEARQQVDHDTIANEPVDEEGQVVQQGEAPNEQIETIPRRSTRGHKPRGMCNLPCSSIAKGSITTPTTLEEAKRGPYAEKWEGAIEEEVQNLEEQGTWVVVKRPVGSTVIGSKWVFAVKKMQMEK